MPISYIRLLGSPKVKRILKGKTSGKKLNAALNRLIDQARFYRYKLYIAELIKALNQPLSGHCAYYGLIFNIRMLHAICITSLVS